MRIFRLEDRHGDGVYSSRVPYEILSRCEKMGIHHHDPESDGMPYRNWGANHYFGFESMDALHRWFPKPMMMPLHQHGIFLVVYEVDECYVCKGRTQLAFIMDHATEVDRQPLNDLARR